ncbi:MAG: PspA/IM30 family protein [Candidatus Eremiobacteraeota bacterium]|nr:PspA/IM30 family protein [Candidatus Eremiobacteraeota bacterium]MCL5054402.1 PspA/IM30 family protein [Bacillota bacterium]
MLKRFIRVIRSWFGFILGKAEDPELILNQYIEDQRANMSKMQNDAVAVIAAEKELEHSVEASQNKLVELDNNVRTAVQAGRDDLASSLIAQKNSEQTNLVSLKAQLEKARQHSTDVKNMLQQAQLNFQKASSERMQLIAENRRAKMQEKVAQTMQSFSSYSDSDTLDRMKEKIKERQARAEAMMDLGTSSTQGQLASLQQSSANVEVQAQLLEYKKQMGLLPQTPAIDQAGSQPQKTMEPLKIEEKPPGT